MESTCQSRGLNLSTRCSRALDEHGALPLERVVALMQKLMSHFDLDSVLAEIVDTAQTLLGAELVTLWMAEADGSRLARVIPSAGVPLTAVAGAGLMGACAAARADQRAGHHR
ncbi:MAG: hypothetical protein ABI389_08750 [Rhodanobacter sp.]